MWPTDNTINGHSTYFHIFMKTFIGFCINQLEMKLIIKRTYKIRWLFSIA